MRKMRARFPCVDKVDTLLMNTLLCEKGDFYRRTIWRAKKKKTQTMSHVTWLGCDLDVTWMFRRFSSLHTTSTVISSICIAQHLVTAVLPCCTHICVLHHGAMCNWFDCCCQCCTERPPLVHSSRVLPHLFSRRRATIQLIGRWLFQLFQQSSLLWEETFILSRFFF